MFIQLFSFKRLSLLSIGSKQRMFKVLSSVKSPGVSPSILLCVLYVWKHPNAHACNIPCKEFWASFAGFRGIAGSAAGQKTLLPCSVLATVSLQVNSLPSDVAGLALLMTMGPLCLSQLFTHLTSHWRIYQQQQSTERTAPLRRAWRTSRAQHGSWACLVQTQFLQLGFLLSVLAASVAHGSCILSGIARPGLTFHTCHTESHHSS